MYAQKVAIGIRKMAISSYHDLMLLYGFSGTNVHRCFQQFLNAVLDVMSLPGCPKDEAGLQELAMGFTNSR